MTILFLLTTMQRFVTMLLALSVGIYAFNIEDRTPVIKSGPSGSLFGLSIAQHHISATNVVADNAVLLVGAPTDDRSSELNVDVTKPGGFYQCAVSTEDECTRVNIMTDVIASNSNNGSNQWLGVAVKSQKPGGKIVVCAHRFTERSDIAPLWEAVLGRCFMLNSNLSPISDNRLFEYTPCSGKRDIGGVYSFQTFGYCQAGTSVSFGEIPSNDAAGDWEYVIFGAPGSFHWAGSVNAERMNYDFFSEVSWSEKPHDEPLIRENDLLGALEVSAVTTNIFALDLSAWSVDDTGPDTRIPKNSYIGSSVTSGRLLGGNVSFISGAPGVNATGAVGIFQKVPTVDSSDDKLQLVEMVYGDRIASRFGHEVLLVDVNGDGRLDLIVGAPQYYDREKKLGGAVYIYLNKELEKFGPSATNDCQKIFGPVDSAFGMSLTSIGDINMDGADDIAIGAPGDDSGLGTIYIYHGDNGENSVGVHREPSQVIRAADLISSGYLKKNITGMGYSISGGLDMDLNGYPDIAAGSLSDSVVLFQTRPIVNIIGKIKKTDRKIVISDSVIGKKQRYNITICLRYTSPIPTFDDEVKVTATLKLDTVRLDSGLVPRASFTTEDPTDSIKSVNVTLFPQSRNKDKCKVFNTFIRDKVQDKLSPIKLELSFTTRNNLQKRRRRQIEVPIPMPIINVAIDNTATGEIQFAKSCGDDEICESKLSMAAYYQVRRDENWNNLGLIDGTPVLKLGTEKQIGMVIDVNNHLGEDAHQAKLRIELPDVLQFRGADILQGSGSELHCDNVDGNKTLALCTLGNPFKANFTLRFRLKLSKNPSIYQASGFDVMLQLETTSRQSGLDSVNVYPVIVQVEAQLTISGYASKEQVKFGGFVVGQSSVKQVGDAGSLHSHFYEVRNTGTGPAENVAVKIQWPQNIENGKWLFYLLAADVRGEKGNCTLPSSVNPLKLKYVPTTRQKRDTLEENNAEPPVLKESVKPPESSLKSLDCESASCIDFECFLGTIDTTDATRYIDLHAVLWNSTFLEEYEGYSEIQVQSRARVTIAQENIKFSEKSRLNSKVSTSVLSEVPIPPVQEVKWWIIVAASVAGVVLLVCLIVLLWKCGFFKRRKFGDYQMARRHKQASQKADERETLY